MENVENNQMKKSGVSFSRNLSISSNVSEANISEMIFLSKCISSDDDEEGKRLKTGEILNERQTQTNKNVFVGHFFCKSF